MTSLGNSILPGTLCEAPDTLKSSSLVGESGPSETWAPGSVLSGRLRCADTLWPKLTAQELLNLHPLKRGWDTLT